MWLGEGRGKCVCGRSLVDGWLVWLTVGWYVVYMLSLSCFVVKIRSTDVVLRSIVCMDFAARHAFNSCLGSTGWR